MLTSGTGGKTDLVILRVTALSKWLIYPVHIRQCNFSYKIKWIYKKFIEDLRLSQQIMLKFTSGFSSLIATASSSFHTF